MMIAARLPSREDPQRAEQLLARVRHRQLDSALRGRIQDSERHAQRAQRVQRAVGLRSDVA